MPQSADTRGWNLVPQFREAFTEPLDRDGLNGQFVEKAGVVSS